MRGRQDLMKSWRSPVLTTEGGHVAVIAPGASLILHQTTQHKETP